MDRLLIIGLVIAISVMNMGGCDSFAKRHLREPVKVLTPAIEQQEPLQTQEAIDLRQKNVKEMMNRMEIYNDSEGKNVEIDPILEDCLWFLVAEFGKPVYQGRVRVVVTDEPSENAFMLWNEKDDQERQVIINHYNLIKPLWYHYIVHELFHAFYQSSEFLRNTPDSIIEGLAIYAQYKYKNQGMNNEKIHDQIYERIIALRSNTPLEGIDWDRPFQSYGETDRRYLYLISGLLFFSQDSEDIKGQIVEMLQFSSSEKMDFEDLTFIYGLNIEGDMFKSGCRKELTLPEPIDYSTRDIKPVEAITCGDQGRQ